MFFRYLYKVASEDKARLPVFGVILLGCAALGQGVGLGWDVAERWRSFDDPVFVEVEAETGVCNKDTGGGYHLRRDGATSFCSGADAKCGVNKTVVAYERANPSYCRVADNIGHPSLFELELLSLVTALLFFGAGLILVHRDAGRRRRLLTRWVFYFGALAFLWCMFWSVVVSIPSEIKWHEIHESYEPREKSRSRGRR